MLDLIFLQLFPYVAVAVAIVESVRRYLTRKFTYSSLSSEFLEREQLFFGSVTWHYAIILVLGAHLLVFLLPGQLLLFNSVPVRLYMLETTGLVLGLLALVGLVMLTVRRVTNDRIRAVTTPMDLLVLALLLGQVGLGVYIALTLRWGSNWYAVALTPYLRSLLMLRPDVSLVSVLPPPVKLHAVGAFAFVALIPFSRLVHFLVIPWQNLWLRPQKVIWNRGRSGAPADEPTRRGRLHVQ